MHARTSILASMPSVVDELKNLESDVPEVIRKQASTDVEIYLLDQASYLNQGNVIIARVLETVRTAVDLTNGRVTERERVSLEQQATLDDYKKFQAKGRFWLKVFIALIAIVAVPIAEIAFNWLAFKAGIKSSP